MSLEKKIGKIGSITAGVLLMIGCRISNPDPNIVLARQLPIGYVIDITDSTPYLDRIDISLDDDQKAYSFNCFGDKYKQIIIPQEDIKACLDDVEDTVDIFVEAYDAKGGYTSYTEIYDRELIEELDNF